MAPPLLHSEAERDSFHITIPGSEKFSFYSHAVGAVAGVFLLLYLVLTSTRPAGFVASALYGSSLIVLFSASALHHAWHPEGQAGRLLLRKIDHGSIFFLIAGTYTPFCLLVLPLPWGISILSVVGGLGVLGIAQKFIWPFAPRWLGVALYIAVGWCVAVAGVPLVKELHGVGVALLLAGGLLYTGGAIIYALKRPDWWPERVGFHGLWHMFVLVAAGLHAAVIVAFVPR